MLYVTLSFKTPQSATVIPSFIDSAVLS